MTKDPKNHNKPWTPSDLNALAALAAWQHSDASCRAETWSHRGAIYAKAAEESISLKPVNQAPYNRLKP